jgi:hypothetical protein
MKGLEGYPKGDFLMNIQILEELNLEIILIQ